MKTIIRISKLNLLQFFLISLLVYFLLPLTFEIVLNLNIYFICVYGMSLLYLNNVISIIKKRKFIFNYILFIVFSISTIINDIYFKNLLVDNIYNDLNVFLFIIPFLVLFFKAYQIFGLLNIKLTKLILIDLLIMQFLVGFFWLFTFLYLQPKIKAKIEEMEENNEINI